jgi:Carboxypeptidase regulatory-like domain/TonB-dependent Receptor Plug Domain
MQKRNLPFYWLWAILLLAASITSAGAQEFRATITGVVTDASKAVIPGATVSVRNLDTNQILTVKTNATGVYNVPYLQPGQRLEVSAEAPGFKESTYPPIVLTISQVSTANFTLQVGGSSEEVKVSSESYSVGLDTEKADRGTVIDNATITQLPLNGRNPLSLMDYIPGVTNEAGPGLETTPNNMYNISFYTVNGTPSQNIDYSIDGMPNNANPWYSNGPSTVPSVDAMQEFKVTTNAYDAQYGHTSSGIVSMELKSGTNSLHGSAYEFAKRGYMDANNWYDNYYGLPRSAHTEDQYGFEVDGPVYLPFLYNGRNKTFFMFNFERFKEVLPTTQTYDVPNQAWMNGDFTNFVDAQGNMMPVFNPFTATTADPTRQLFQNGGTYNQVNTALYNPIAVNIVNLMLTQTPITTQRVAGELPWENLWLNTTPTTNSSQNYVVKFDQALGGHDHLSGNWIRSMNPSYSPNAPSGVVWWNGSTFTEYHMNTGVDWVHTFSSNLLTDVRASYQRYWRTDGPIAANLDYDPSQLGFSQALLNELPLKSGFPEINFNMQQQSAGTGNGYNNWLAMSRDFYYMPDDSYNLQPTITWDKGKHNLRAGLDFRISHLWQSFQYDNIAAYTSSGIATSEYWNANNTNDIAVTPNGQTLSQNGSGNAILDFLLGQPNTVQVQNQDLPYYTKHYYAPWVQDDWKVNPKLTLNLGFRWDFNGPPTARHDWVNTGFDFNVTNPIDASVDHAAYPGLPTLKGGILFPGNSGTNLPWAQDYTKWQPRVGFSWLATPTTVVRGGAGRTVMSTADNPQSAGFANNPSYSMSPDGGRTYYQNNLGNPFPTGIPTIVGAGAGLETYLGEGIAFANPHYRLPTVINGSLGVQQAFPHDGKLEISYVMSRGYGYDTNYSNLNTNFDLYKSCNDALGTTSNPYPEGACTNAVANPFLGIPGFVGSYETAQYLQAQYLANPYPQFTGIEEVQNNWGRSWYNSMQTTYQQRLGFDQLSSSWTWSKTMQSGGYIDGVYLIPFRSIAGTDRQHRFTVINILNIPVGRGRKYFSGMNRVTDAVVGGWELATNGFYETGQPVGLPQGYNLVGNIRAPLAQRQAATPDVINYNINQCINLWNPATPTTPGYYKLFTGNGQSAANCNNSVAWQQVAPYAPNLTQASGSTMVYTDQVRAPGANQIDVNLSKNFKITERFTMQLRMEEFNVLNHPNWYGQVDMSPTDTEFGSVVKALYGQSNNPRFGQLAVKVTW